VQYVDNQKCLFCEVVKMCNGLHYCVPLVEMVKKTYMERPIWGPDERVMPPRKYMNYQYYRSEITGTISPRRFCADINYDRYYRSIRDRYYRWMAEGGVVWREYELPMDGGRSRRI
jgi:hypothetical protein